MSSIKFDDRTLNEGMEVSSIYKFKDTKMVPDPFLKYKAKCSSKENNETPAIVIDNGKKTNRVC